MAKRHQLTAEISGWSLIAIAILVILYLLLRKPKQVVTARIKPCPPHTHLGIFTPGGLPTCGSDTAPEYAATPVDQRQSPTNITATKPLQIIDAEMAAAIITGEIQAFPVPPAPAEVALEPCPDGWTLWQGAGSASGLWCINDQSEAQWEERTATVVQ